jgi:putative nucleotidyltransferase with HDIG domain
MNMKVLDNLDYALQLITAVIQKRDPYTAEHQIRVTRLAVPIAQEMGMSKSSIEAVRLTASLHDIGKINIPFEILNRPTRLSEAEFALIKTHVQTGYEILSPISFPWPVAEIVQQHHERLDGSGYPLHINGNSILPEARVLAVADVIEAMTTHRPYRPALGIDAALEEVSRLSGRLYDTEAVDACIRLLLIKNFSFQEDLN